MVPESKGPLLDLLLGTNEGKWLAPPTHKNLTKTIWERERQIVQASSCLGEKLAGLIVIFKRLGGTNYGRRSLPDCLVRDTFEKPRCCKQRKVTGTCWLLRAAPKSKSPGSNYGHGTRSCARAARFPLGQISDQSEPWHSTAPRTSFFGGSTSRYFQSGKVQLEGATNTRCSPFTLACACLIACSASRSNGQGRRSDFSPKFFLELRSQVHNKTSLPAAPSQQQLRP